MMTRYAIVSGKHYFSKKKSLWFSKWCSNEPLPATALRAHDKETEAQRYVRLARSRGDRILYAVNCRLKG